MQFLITLFSQVCICAQPAGHQEAVSFVKATLEEVKSVISVSPNPAAELARLLTQKCDVNTMASLVLTGVKRQFLSKLPASLSPKEKNIKLVRYLMTFFQSFVEAFRFHIVNSYSSEDRLNLFRNSTMTVGRSFEMGRVTVVELLFHTGQESPPVLVEFHVGFPRQEAAARQLMFQDIRIEGISLLKTEQDIIDSLYRDYNGDIKRIVGEYKVIKTSQGAASSASSSRASSLPPSP